MPACRIDELLTRATELAQVSDTARLDLELLLCHVLDKPRSYLFSYPEYELTSDQLSQFEQLFHKRLEGHPIAHLTGVREFWSLELLIEPSTLIPRPDTECLVEEALELCDHRPKQVLDLGTGTGAIALALASERPGWAVYGCDRVPDAVELAKKNAAHNNLERVQFIESSWFQQLPEQSFDLIVSNPPYIIDNDPHLQQGDVRFEPLSALTSGADGLDDIRHISSESPHWLRDGGWLMMEHGYHQGEDVREILASNGFTSIRTVQDLAGHDRITMGQIRSSEI
ncbi:peptide chain release factor N(5)-glutamine methyltransferase [Sansalvadorimonas verongulae]|uniref:peptide chain release factor N(5)-glutamine methyltransferase n=1 Tax=Sansalvadorimonas verongulae TaxID=2172824 RepID=UPI0012BC4ABF|nr:peptide chain release factor N(5)-glutamine methyltransferase [Sansalvadorimonas verongulae]MTI15535.1 peptide chain release factor N(5)-glutamine methyltransferase [Sansalvadorimonas verongulae]